MIAATHGRWGQLLLTLAGLFALTEGVQAAPASIRQRGAFAAQQGVNQQQAVNPQQGVNLQQGGNQPAGAGPQQPANPQGGAHHRHGGGRAQDLVNDIEGILQQMENNLGNGNRRSERRLERELRTLMGELFQTMNRHHHHHRHGGMGAGLADLGNLLNNNNGANQGGNPSSSTSPSTTSTASNGTTHHHSVDRLGSVGAQLGKHSLNRTSTQSSTQPGWLSGKGNSNPIATGKKFHLGGEFAKLNREINKLDREVHKLAGELKSNGTSSHLAGQARGGSHHEHRVMVNGAPATTAKSTKPSTMATSIGGSKTGSRTSNPGIVGMNKPVHQHGSNVAGGAQQHQQHQLHQHHEHHEHAGRFKVRAK
jgi:hypothetical protein